MSNVCVLQTDNRPTLNYLLKTQQVNQKWCDTLGYNYSFIKMNHKYGNIHPATKKIHIIHDWLQTASYDVLVFLDSDAWIQNGHWLQQLIQFMNRQQKNGCFSRDPYVRKNTFINSGSFILKINEFTKQMYKDIIHHLYRNVSYHHTWPFDQYYISNYVFENKRHFIIFIPDILNTPLGKILRHNWYKNQKMYDDLDQLIEGDTIHENTMCIERSYDTHRFPNLMIHGNEYFE